MDKMDLCIGPSLIWKQSASKLVIFDNNIINNKNLQLKIISNNGIILLESFIQIFDIYMYFSKISTISKSN
jgi:hypothetical protein